MLSLSELKVYVKNKTMSSKRVLSEMNDIANFIEITILLELDSGNNKFTVVDINDLHYYVDKRLKKKELKAKVINELESNNYTYHIISSRKIAVHLDEGAMKKPKLWVDYNIVIAYFIGVSAVNLICLLMGLLSSSFAWDLNKFIYIGLFCTTILMAYINSSNSCLQHKLYEVSKRVYNKN